MSSNVVTQASPRAVSTAGLDAERRREQAIIDDALRHIPSLSPITPALHRNEAAEATQLVSRADSSHALAAEDEELLLQELANMTAGAAPFVSGSSKLAEAAANEAAASLAPASPPSSQPSASTSTPASAGLQATAVGSGNGANGGITAASPPAPTPKKPTASATKRAAITLREEQVILDAILAAVDGQQSSVSGDLADFSGAGDTEEQTAAAGPAAADDSTAAKGQVRPPRADDAQDAVDQVLEQAKLLASSTVLCDTQRGELVLHIHEHVVLRRPLAELRKTVGTPTCVALAESTRRTTASTTAPAAATGVAGASTSSTKTAPPQRSLCVAIGTSLGAVALFDQSWHVLGVCGSVEASVVNARGAVVSLSLCTPPAKRDAEEPTAATGHAKGVFILWSLQSFASLRVIKDECKVPLLRVQHLFHDPSRVLVLESSGAVKLFQFWKVMTKHMLRSTTITTASTAAPMSDMDTLPCPSALYLHNLAGMKEHLATAASAWNSDGGVAWLCAPPPISAAAATAAGVSRGSWSTVPDKHLVATVSNDAVLVFMVETGLQSSVSGVARHTHPPSSALSNELVRFVVMEQDGAAPRVLVCVSWNTEVELLLLNLKLPDLRSSTTGAGTTAGSLAAAEPQVQGLERLALLRVSAPLVQMVPLASCSMLLLDQQNNAHLMDASVAVIMERHHFETLEYVSFVSRFRGPKHHGTVASNRTSALLLGKDTAYGVSIYSWRERLSALVARRRYAEALDLAKGFAEEVALAVVGLSSNAAARRRELHQYMERILLAYLEHHLDATSSAAGASARKESEKKPTKDVANGKAGDSPESSTASLLDVLQHIASYCGAVDGLDLLYGSITRLLQQRGLLPQLLCVLERSMRNGIITYMPDPLIERFIDLFLHEDQLRAVEVALGVRQPPVASGASAKSMDRNSGSPTAQERGSDDVPGAERAELALMCLDTGLSNLLRLAQEHHLLRLSVTILSYRQQQYVEALAYALDEEEPAASAGATVATSSSVAMDLVEYTLKDCTLLPGADLPAHEQRPAKKALLEYLLQTDANGQHHLLRFLRPQPQRAMRVLLFALSDEGLCSPWSTDGFSRTQFVSSVYFILTGGTRTQPRRLKSSDDLMMGRASRGSRSQPPCNLFLLDEDELARLPGLRLLRAAELAQRSFPPYEAVHTFLAGAALFDELFLSDGAASGGGGNASVVRFDIWVDLVIQDGLFVFQTLDTVEDRRGLQEHLIRVLTPPFIPRDRVAAFQPDFARLRMARCLAALLCKEQRYAEAIGCFLDPLQNNVDDGLQHDVFTMLRGEMQRLQDLRTHTELAARQRSSTSRRFESDVFTDAGESRDGSSVSGGRLGASTPLLHDDADTAGQQEMSRQVSSFVSAPSTSATGPIDAAIKALQRAVMSRVEALVCIDATALAQFIFDFLPANHREVMRLLRGSSAAFLDYLDELLAQGDPAVVNDMHLQNTYIELLCAHAPQRVFPHLRDKGSSITYDVQVALRAVRKYRIADASIFLLEKTMMIEDAMDVMVRAARAALAEVRDEVLTQVGAKDDSHLTHNGAEAASSSSDTNGPTPKAGISGAATSTESKSSARPLPAGVQQPRQPATSEADSVPPIEMHALPAFAELQCLIAIGKELCSKYQADQAGGGASSSTATAGASAAPGGSAAPHRPEYWFRLLDIFMVPRRLLCEALTSNTQLLAAGGRSYVNGSPAEGCGDTGMENELEVAARLAMAVKANAASSKQSSTRAPSPLPAVSDNAQFHLPPLSRPLKPDQQAKVEALVAVYTQCTSDILRSMMHSLDLSVVVDKVVQDNKDEAFRAFKPIVLDMMSSLSFELEANRLCESATESDVMSLGRELYQQLNTGIVAQSDSCALCHLHLSEPAPPPPTTKAATAASGAAASPTSSTPSSSAVCVFMCGHAYHAVCSLHAMGHHPGCYVCTHQRFSAATATAISSAPADARGAAGASAAAAAPPPPSGSGRPEASTFDLARAQRRMRQTKVKVDHSEDLYPLLKSFLTWGTSTPSTPSNAQTTSHAAAGEKPSSVTDGGGGSWVLAPSPRVPVAIGDINHNASHEAAAPVRAGEKGQLDVETLTDAEILELFGDL